jgi:hypothetical protein
MARKPSTRASEDVWFIILLLSGLEFDLCSVESGPLFPFSFSVLIPSGHFKRGCCTSEFLVDQARSSDEIARLLYIRIGLVVLGQKLIQKGVLCGEFQATVQEQIMEHSN